MPTGHVSDTSGVSVIGHTRFATGSLNTMPELHPHDWSASGYDADKLLGHHDRERIWWWDGQNHQMVEKLTTFAVHLTHNGDFEVRECAQVATFAIPFAIEQLAHAPRHMNLTSSGFRLLQPCHGRR